MNKNILSFLQAYLEWAEADAPASGVFEPSSGMCGNLIIYLREYTSLEWYARRDVRVDFSFILLTAFGCSSYPFGADTYNEECVQGTHHRNPERLDWIRNQLEKCND